MTAAEALEGATGARLDNPANNGAARAKWRRMEWLRHESLRKRQRLCMSRPRSRVVQLRRSAEYGAGFAGLQSCGGVTCPHCGPKIAAHRRAEIAQAVNLWRAVHGRKVFFGTLTLRHHRRQSFDALADAVSACWKAATNGRSWRKDRDRYGVRGFVRVFETTHSALNGWHVHVHFLLFTDSTLAAPDPLLRSMFTRWAAKAGALGLAVPLLRGQDLVEARGDDVADRMGAYFAKDAEVAGEASGEALGWELAGGGGKRARGSHSMSPGALLDYAIAGDRAAENLWGEYELGMEGRRTVGWSRGLRALLGVGLERTDDDVAAEEAGDSEDAVVSFTGPQWRRLVERGLRGPVLAAAASLDPVDLLAWLAEHEVTCMFGAVPVDWGGVDA